MNRLRRLAAFVSRPWGAAAVAGLITLVFVLWLPAGEDAAAHLYQTQRWKDWGWQFWDNFWYAGRYSQINYSLLYYPLAAVLGTATVVATSVAAAAGAFSRIMHRRWPQVAMWPSVAFALLAPLPALNGTYPFLLGLALGLATLVALQAGRRKTTVALTALVAVAHLLALLLLVTVLIGIAAATPRWWQRHGVRPLAVGLAGVVGAAAVMWRAFSTPGGDYPFDIADLVVVLIFCAAGLWLARGRPELRILRGIFAVYGFLALAAFAISSPVGANIGRLLIYMGVPLLLIPLATREFRPRVLSVTLLLGALAWQTFPVVTGVRASTQVQSASEEYWYPVEAFLATHGSPDYRVEVVATDHHWEALYLARRGVPLTRGWYRQDDFPANQDLYGELTATKYHTWLRRLGVRYVFLPDDRLDYSAQAEAALLRESQVLPQVARVGGWSVYEVPNATPIATPASLISVREINSEAVTFTVREAGSYRLRLRYTPYWRVIEGDACVAPREPWATELRVGAPGTVTLRFDVGVGEVVKAVLGRTADCTDIVAPAAPDPGRAVREAPQAPRR